MPRPRRAARLDTTAQPDRHSAHKLLAGYYTTDGSGTATDGAGAAAQRKNAHRGAIAALLGRHSAHKLRRATTPPMVQHGCEQRATAQVGCASGYYSAAGSTQCSQALAGYYTTDGSGTATDGAGAAAQEECPSGRYSNSTGTTQCTQAQAGYYTVSAIGGTTPSNSGALDET